MCICCLLLGFIITAYATRVLYMRLQIKLATEREAALAATCLAVFLTSSDPAQDLKIALSGFKGSSSPGLEQRVARLVLIGLVETFGVRSVWSKPTRRLHRKALPAATEFVARYHGLEVVVGEISALAVMAVFAPYMVEALGFTRFRRVQGSLAAEWQGFAGDFAVAETFVWLQQWANEHHVSLV